ncbi:protein phosphatase 2C domain-containing protein [Mycobacterium sp. ITM-2016-00317]|uniref:protein phosphatase 2C domain-containing protein n=1 Tax=Mycobacterium sp. ITM-2016-00317 TaxID=2099694 RepID=UPI00287FCCE0|nr:protein phosphatase 2C domain-containing protein [Mycobacterium sp. ITM-2016-00317]WNG86354.1 protein phosphatase 2C domain-containing protein [Mycobacterium sp. ITM-2016-00317]
MTGADDESLPTAAGNASDEFAVEILLDSEQSHRVLGINGVPRPSEAGWHSVPDVAISVGTVAPIDGELEPNDREASETQSEGVRRAVVSEVSGPVRVPQLIIGSASPDVEATPIGEAFRSLPFRPDTIVDGWSTNAMTVWGASLRGHFHRYNGSPRQDDFAIHLMQDGRIVAIVADGVSAAAQSHLGSSAVVNYAAQWLLSQVPTATEATDWEALVKSTAWALTERAQVVFKTPEPDPGLAENELATTMTCAVVEEVDSGAYRAFVIGVGDSGAWLLHDGEFRPVLDGKTVGEGGISSSAVSGLPRVPSRIEPSIVEFGHGDVLLLGTDGIGDPLGGGQGGVGNLFRELFGAAAPSLIEFAHAVDFSRETFDDDRTLVAIRPRTPGSK